MRTLIAAGATLAIAAVSAGPASAATIDVSNLPDAVTIAESDRIDVTDARTLLCGTGDLSVYVPGRRDAVTVSNVACSGSTLTATITPTATSKTTSVVKFRLRKPDGSVAMLTLVVRVDR